MENKKKTLVLSIIAIATLLIVVLGATYAFFVAQGGGSSNTNVDVQTNTTDNLSFSVGDAINITATQDNFSQGLGNQAGSTTASATLTANNATNTATRNYYLYLNITSNDFEYTVDENTPELILTITDPEGNPVTSLPGLSYKTDVITNGIDGEVQTVSGFDITTKTGSITIADNYEITSTSTVTQEWNVTVTFVNLDSDQEGNAGKIFNASLVIRENSPIGIAEVATSNITADAITLTVNATSENTITKYYYAKDEEEYIESDSNTYTFTGLESNTEYTLRAYAVDDEGYKSAVYSLDVTTDISSFADYLIENVYTGVDGENGLYLHDGEGTYGTLEAEDNSYRYSGANPNNYVCFGTDAEVCPEENLYRIIGVFDGQVKLIKNDYATESTFGQAPAGSGAPNMTYYKGSLSTIHYYRWNTATNDWSSSTLNLSILNNTYLNILQEWQDLIAETTWKVGGNNMAAIANTTVKNTYVNEIVNPAESTVYNAKVGLMYASEYGYAASPENWTTNLYNYNNDNNRTNNWMYMGAIEWIILRDSDTDNRGFRLDVDGSIGNSDIYGYFYAIRPTFSLNEDIELASGTGTSSDPYKLVI